MTEYLTFTERFTTMRVRLLSATAILLLVVACGGESTGPGAGPTVECTKVAASFTAGTATFITAASGIQYRDVSVGSGATLAAGSNVSVRYAGCLTTGYQFDANNSPKDLFTFRIGTGKVILGFDQAFVGMKVGGVREVIIPSSLGYGATAQSDIPANSTLVFTIAPVSVQ